MCHFQYFSTFFNFLVPNPPFFFGLDMPAAICYLPDNKSQRYPLPGGDRRGRELAATSPATNGWQEEMGGRDAYGGCITFPVLTYPRGFLERREGDETWRIKRAKMYAENRKAEIWEVHAQKCI